MSENLLPSLPPTTKEAFAHREEGEQTAIDAADKQMAEAALKLSGQEPSVGALIKCLETWSEALDFDDDLVSQRIRKYTKFDAKDEKMYRWWKNQVDRTVLALRQFQDQGKPVDERLLENVAVVINDLQQVGRLAIGAEEQKSLRQTSFMENFFKHCGDTSTDQDGPVNRLAKRLKGARETVHLDEVLAERTAIEKNLNLDSYSFWKKKAQPTI